MMVSRLLYFTFVSLFLMNHADLSSQNSYLDMDYGVNGTAELLGQDQFYSRWTGLYFDNEDRLYVAYSYGPADSLVYGIKRLDENGMEDGWKFERQVDSSVEERLTFLISNNKLLITSQSIDQNTEFVYSVLSVYDLDLNQVTQIELPVVELDRYWYTYSIFIDNDDRIWLLHESIIYRYLMNGDLDRSFGNGGEKKFRDLDDDPELFAFNYYSQLNYMPSGEVYATYYKYDTTVVGNYNFYPILARISEDGSFDETFGDEGTIRFDDGHLLVTLKEHGEGLLIQEYDFIILDSCWIRSTISKYGEGGRLKNSFGNNGRLDSIGSICDGFHFHLLTGPRDDIMLTYYDSEIVDNNQIVHLDYHLERYNEDGHPDRDFYDNGRLHLEFLDNNDIFNMAQDGSNNIYVTHSTAGFVALNEPIYISKFKASELWQAPLKVDIDERFTIMPNPTAGPVTISYEGEGRASVEVSIYDIQGRLVTSKAYSDLANGQVLEILNRAMPSGTYMVKVRDDKEGTIYDSKVMIIN